jgi:hypothetical protein
MPSRHRLLRAIQVFGECSEETRLVEALVAAGFGRRESRQLKAFLPLAFGRAVIEAKWQIDFGKTVSAQTRTGAWVEIPLRDLPLYQAALSLARESYKTGLVPRELFSAVATHSADLNTVSDALDAGLEIDHAMAHTALVELSAEEMGYGSRWSRIWACLWRGR